MTMDEILNHKVTGPDIVRFINGDKSELEERLPELLYVVSNLLGWGEDLESETVKKLAEILTPEMLADNPSNLLSLTHAPSKKYPPGSTIRCLIFKARKAGEIIRIKNKERKKKIIEEEKERRVMDKYESQGARASQRVRAIKNNLLAMS